MKYAIKDLKLIEEEKAVIPVTNKFSFFSFSVYESVKVLNKKICFAEEHAARLMDSARIIGLEHPFSREEIVESMTLLVEANHLNSALLRIQLIGGDENISPLLFIFSVGLTFYPKKFYRDGIKVVTFEGERFIPESKTNNLLLNFLAYRKAQKSNALDALLVNLKGEIFEGTRSNLFVINGKTLITSGKDILKGITRKHIIETAEMLGLGLKLAKLKLSDVLNGRYDCVFISSTSMGAMPISQIDEISIPCNTKLIKEINQIIEEKRGLI